MRARLALTWCKRPRPIATRRCSTPPMLFDAMSDLRRTGPARFGGWAFQGPLSVPVAWAA